MGESLPTTVAQRLEKPMRVTEQEWPEGTVPEVSILCVTYNHAKFIRDAVEGFLMQETSFPVQIVIHDDASADGTGDILSAYAARYPKLIHCVIQRSNLWPKTPNAAQLIRLYCNGEFIALCEGDDFWSSPDKLQRQVDYMRATTGCSCCFHLAALVDERNNMLAGFFQPRKQAFNTTECLLELGKQYATNSMLFRKSALIDTPLWMVKNFNDAFLELQLSRHGTIDFLPAKMSSYRIHRDGMWSGMTAEQRIREQLKRYKLLLKADWIPSKLVRSKIAECRASLLRESNPLLFEWLERCRVLLTRLLR